MEKERTRAISPASRWLSETVLTRTVNRVPSSSAASSGERVLSCWTGKGDLIGVSGKLEENNYEDAEGVKHYTLQVNARDIEFLNTKKEEQEEEQPRKKYKK